MEFVIRLLEFSIGKRTSQGVACSDFGEISWPFVLLIHSKGDIGRRRVAHLFLFACFRERRRGASDLPSPLVSRESSALSNFSDGHG